MESLGHELEKQRRAAKMLLKVDRKRGKSVMRLAVAISYDFSLAVTETRSISLLDPQDTVAGQSLKETLIL